MAKTKLNNGDRDAIATMIIDNKFAKQIAINRKHEYQLANKCYNRLYSPSLRQAMSKLPERSFDTLQSFMINVSGKKFVLFFSPNGQDCLGFDPSRDKAEKITKPFLFKHRERWSGGPTQLSLDETIGDLGGDIVELMIIREYLKSEPHKDRTKLDTVLKQFVYFDDLITAFPQAERFIMKRWRDRPEGGSPGVPAVCIEDLARELELP